MKSVGIDKASFYTSQYFLSLTTLAEGRNVDPDKYTIGLGQRKMAVMPPDESIVTMAAAAAERILQDEDKSKIRTLLLATESSSDLSKSAGIYVHRLLDLNPHCRVIETKQACYSGTCAIQLALSHVSRFSDEKVLVITSDIARYGLGTPGESSQGGGAIAMLISTDPRLLAIEPEAGLYTEDVMDFWRPIYREAPLVEGKISCDQYLKALKATWADYHERSKRAFSDHQHFIYHIPFPRLAEKAHQKLSMTNGQGRPSAEALSAALDNSLEYSREIGNCYTGSLYLGLISLLENNSDDLTGQRIGLYSYGSGCVAEFYSATVQPNYQAQLFTKAHQEMLSERTELDMTQYESFYSYQYPEDGSSQTMPEQTTNAYRLSAVENHKQIYIKKQGPKRHHQKTITAIAPGKLIITGEHAVVSGGLAIAMAVQHYAKTSITRTEKRNSIFFNLRNMEHKGSYTVDKLRSVKNRLKTGYQGFLKGEKGLRDVMHAPFELMQYTASNVLETLSPKTDIGVEIQTQSDIPIGCGMGSSAASIVSTNYALSHFFDSKDLTTEKYFELGLDAENLQHGRSSGLDIQMALQGGLVAYQKGKMTPLPKPNFMFFARNTGQPSSITGDCVNQTQALFKQRPELLLAFDQTAQKVQQAILNNDQTLMMQAIRENHRLLVEIGVVPQAVQDLIAQIEALGGAAKISGAGSIQGDGAGYVLALGLKAPEKLGFEPVAVDDLGVHIEESA